MRWLERFSFRKAKEGNGVPKNVGIQRSLLIGVLSFASACGLPELFEKEGNSEAQLESAKGVNSNDPNCYLGCPTGAPISNQEIQGAIYTLSNNGRTKFADWVAYCVTEKGLKGKKIERRWKADPQLPADETLEPEDYKGAHEALNIDRGHQVPLANFKGTGHAHETNFLSNITPQKSNLNQGPWNDLEENERESAKKKKKVCVVTGPLYEKAMPSLPNADEEHQIPSGYWKVLIVRDTREQIKTAAFIMPQDMKKRGRYCDTQVSIDEVERRAGLDLFPDMKDEEENKVEALEHGELAEDLGCRGKSKSKKKPKRRRKKSSLK